MPMSIPHDVVGQAVLAGALASLACGLGVLPLAIRRFDPVRHRGIGYAVAGGLMFAASVYNLILPGLSLGDAGWQLGDVVPIIGGVLLGSAFLAAAEARLHRRRKVSAPSLGSWGGRVGLLVFIAMTIHSVPEGIAVGVGYASDAVGPLPDGSLGPTLALAIAIHNMPEGLAVAIPMRSGGSSLLRCFVAAVATSLPQPVAAVPAVMLAWFFHPMMPVMMGFSAGAMMFLIILELIPIALETETPTRIAWAFTAGFCLMLLVQIAL